MNLTIDSWDTRTTYRADNEYTIEVPDHDATAYIIHTTVTKYRRRLQRLQHGVCHVTAIPDTDIPLHDAETNMIPAADIDDDFFMYKIEEGQADSNGDRDVAIHLNEL